MLAAAVASVICSVAARGAPARATASCADLVRYQGKLYEGTFVGGTLHRGARVGAVRPGCNDTPGAHEPDVAVTVGRVAAVAPSLALLAADDARHVYLVSGVFPENPNHPLHIALYGNRARPNECLGARVLGSLRIRGTVAETPLPFNLLLVRSGNHVTSLIVDAWTRLGFPVTRRLVQGARVDVTASRCLKPNATRPLLVARRVALR